MVDAILAASAGRAVLDVGIGIGTGISARPFADAGCRVLGVEPDECMAEVARRAGFEVEIATFEGWQPAGRVFDLVIAGPAWHWVDPVLGAHKAAEVLRPGGRLALFWNAFSYPPGVAAAFADLHRRLLPELPFPPSGASGEVAAYASLSERAVAGLGQRGGSARPSGGASTGRGPIRETSGSTRFRPSEDTVCSPRPSSTRCSPGWVR